MKHLYTLLFLLLLMPLTAQAQEYHDVVFLKNGSVIKGFYSELFPSDSLYLTTIDGGHFICAMSDVDRIAKERQSVYLIDMTEEYKHDESEWRHRGYRGSIETGYNTNTDNSRISVNSLFTIHGYQFNQYLFAGVGFGLEQITYKDHDYTLIINQNNLPVIGDLRLYLMRHSISPVIDVRAGYTVVGYKGAYFNPSVGVDFSLTPRCGLFLLAGYFEQHYETETEQGRSKNISFHVGFHF